MGWFGGDLVFFFFKQKTAYEMRIRDWSSDVCSSDLGDEADRQVFKVPSLRNVAVTAPYFHAGSAPTLERAVEVMFKYQLGREPLKNDTELIVEFLKTLRSEERRVWKACVSTCRSRWSPYH